MRVHHLNVATMCFPAARLVQREGGLMERARLVCHSLVVETEDGLVVVDTGLGLDDIADPVRRLGRGFVTLAGPRLDPAETAVRQIERLGFRAGDVRHLVPTHLDVDHAGGLSDFPRARVHVHRAEHAAAMKRATLFERERYRPRHWAHGPAWVLYEETGERWFDLPCVRPLEGLPPEILLVPLAGHTRGHCAVAVRGDRGWLLHAGDAYFFRDEMDLERPRCTPGLLAFQKVAAMREEGRLAAQARLRALRRDHGDEVAIFCAHDPVELAAFAPA